MPKPKNKKKGFIDKKNAVSFHLVHRSQQDPLAADSDANQMVLQPMSKIKEEEREFGVFFEDEYNYLQHLKDRSQVEHDWSEADRFIMTAGDRRQEAGGEDVKDITGLQLPSSVFGASRGEEEAVGLLNKAAPRGLDLSLDPDIVAAMDDDFNFDDPDNEFDDDFVMQLAQGGGEGSEEDIEEDDEDQWEDDSDDCAGGRSEDEEDDQCPSLLSWAGEETGTKFTNYSMSSSVIRRNQQLSLLDDKFDKFMDQYDEAEEGALEGEEIEGCVEETSVRMSDLMAEHEREKALRRQQLERENVIQKLSLLDRSDSEEEVDIVKVEDKGEKWDCESILSTYSTLYNHPKLISEPRNNKIQLSSKTGIPKGVLGRGLTAGALRQLDQGAEDMEDDVVSVKSKISELSIRPKHETPEEKKDRKTNLKQARRERREEKKANSEAFKSEKMRQEKNIMNNKNNLQGIKIY